MQSIPPRFIIMPLQLHQWLLSVVVDSSAYATAALLL
jgi:hypothetical protein